MKLKKTGHTEISLACAILKSYGFFQRLRRRNGSSSGKSYLNMQFGCTAQNLTHYSGSSSTSAFTASIIKVFDFSG